MASSENWYNRRKGKQSGDLFKLDTKNKTPGQNIVDILQGLYLKKHHETSPTSKSVPTDIRPVLRGMQRNGSDSRRLSYLNALVTLLCKEDRSVLGFGADELMTCIRISLVDDSMVIRAAALRVLRYLIKIESDVATFNTLKLPYLVMRSMDLMLRNEEERAQALRVVRRVIGVVGAGQSRRHRAAYIDHGLLRCLVAVARAGSAGDGTGDRLARPAIATLAEICVLSPELFIASGGVAAVTRQLAECATPRMAEALCGVLLHALNAPTARRAARIDLSCLAAPYCDFHVRPAGTDAHRDEREMRFTCSRLALLCVLRSWPGLLHFCHPYSSGGLRALVAALYLPRLEVRKAILDLLYELVGLPQPEWTDEISVALDAVDPSDFQDSWRLNEGFIAAEGSAILPHLSATGPDITEIHLALLLQCFLEAGLLDGLAEVIVTSDTFISVRATVLLGQLLHLIHLFLPPQICSITPALPSLMAQAAAGMPQALAAVAALRRLHSILEARPATSSLFLDHIIQYCSGAFKEKEEDTTKSRKEKDNATMAKPKPDASLRKENSIEFLNDSDNENEPKQRHSVGSRADVPNRNISALVKSKSVSSRTSAAVSKVTKSAKFLNLFDRDSDSLIRCTLVIQNKDGNTWNWEIIRTILKEHDGGPMLNLNESGHRTWVARIINYLKPSSNKYSHTDSTTCHGHCATRAGCQLIRHLLRYNDLDSQRMLEELYYDVSRQIEAIETGRKAHECLFSPQHMCNTMCQMYFLFIGQLCHTQTGLRLFKQTRLYENLLELSTKTHHSCYVKLVISSLDYTLDSYPRDILAKTLTCNIQASRLYATQFLNVLLRASRKSRELVRRKSKLKKNFVQEHFRSHKDEMDGSSGVDMDTWIFQMLVGQVKDESKAVVKCALSILEEAYSVPAYVEKLLPLKDTLGLNCRLDKSSDPTSLDLSAVGDRGYLLWLCLEVAAAAQTSDSKSSAFLKKHLDFWTKSYNYRYVRLIEAAVHEALTLCEGGRPGARTRRAARVPPNLHAALAACPAAPFARALLAATLPTHYKILQRKKCTSEQEIMDLKASLWALGNTAVTPHGLQQIMHLTNGYLEDSVPVHIVRLVRYSPVYSVRATAFYVLGLFGSTFDGANLLADLGWLCVRHTRHDQFPVITDETYLTYDVNVHNYPSNITSPDRRYNTYDVDTSEHSDHTEQSVAESLHDYPKQLNKTGLISTDDQKDQDVVDHKINVPEGRREPEKRKSNTLPIQGCSSSHDRPTLSESRTVDILRDCSNYERLPHMRAENRLLIGRMNSLEQAHEGRVRNTSESSTSGVSSCDSFLGKYAIPDRVRELTLSPIPSSSSLYGMKSTSSSQRPKISDLQRRTSTSSFTTPDVASSPPTQMDMTGYATLKSLNRRPHVSESAATGTNEIDDLCWLITGTDRRSKPFSSLRDRAKSTRERMTKLSLLDYDWKPLSLADGRQSPQPPPRAPRRIPAPSLPHPPAYIGICLPRDLIELFPRESDGKEEDETTKDQPRRNRVPSFLVDSSNASTDNKSRATPDSQKLAYLRSGDVLRSATNFVASTAGAGPSSILSRTGTARELMTSLTEVPSASTALPTGGTNTKLETRSTNTGATGFKVVNEEEINVNDPIVDTAPSAKDTDKPSFNKTEANFTNIVDKTGIKNVIDIGARGDVADGPSHGKNITTTITGLGDTMANLCSNDEKPVNTSDNVNVTTETKPNINTTPSDIAATSSTTSGVRSNVSTAASDTGTKSSTAASDAGTTSSKGVVVKPTSGAVNTSAPTSEVGNTNTLTNKIDRWRHSTVDCLLLIRPPPRSTHELREAFFAGMDASVEARGASSPIPERSPQAEVLHHVHFMANPIHLRQTRSSLLALKQRYPEVFRSPCVYSDVCALLSRDTYMLCARRFLQELFLDTSFECFAAEPANVIARRVPLPSPTASTSK
ncbi:rapamycin-insensitive companion of mTOR [Hyposmocoma kahamanoa]|uniref:rapamycin-insensitive companion of mTOR n=1 Tax=Hyposmocoma kahamanoa TaxID=1477025 RepID=UPI000E6D74FD|nr:rapamycin-insensitive companion of mTOR [Hyposmocoma kahamanoa]